MQFIVLQVDKIVFWNINGNEANYLLYVKIQLYKHVEHKNYKKRPVGYTPTHVTHSNKYANTIKIVKL